MNKQLTYFILLALIALAGCTKMEEWESNVVQGNYTLKASIESNGPSLSRTVVDDGGQVLWTQHDSIGVFGDKGTANAPFELAAGMGPTSGSFKGDLPEGEEANVAYYPYAKDADLNGQTLTFTLPDEYVYTGNSNAPMLGVKGEGGNFSFKHLAGLLKIVIHGAPEEAAKFVVTSEGEEAAGLTGTAQVVDITDEEPMLRLVGNIGKTVTYILPDKVEGELYFYVPIPVGIYGQLSVSLLKEDDTPYWTKTISNREVRRAVMVNMPVLYHVTPDYVDVDWSNVKVTSSGTDANSFTLQFENGAVPEFVSGQSIVVVPCNNSLYLRRVMLSEVDGNSVDLNTIPAGMTELFRNTEFSLALTPENGTNTRTSAGSGNVYYPIRIVGWNADGTCTTLYDKELATRAEAEAKDTIHLYDLDLSGEEIAKTENEVLTLSWKSFKEKLDLTANAYFKFGEAIDEKEIDENLKVRISDLEACRFTLGASALLELIPQIEAHGEYELEVEEHSLISMPKSYTFFFMAGGVPVAVALSCDLLADFTLNGEATVNVSGGVTLEGSIEAGMQYNKASDEWEPLANASFDYEVHPLEVTGDAEINMRATAYPKMELKLYDFIGPTFAPKPVLEDTIKGFKEIIEGKYDHIPEQAFYMVGTIEDVLAKAKKMEEAA